MSLSGGDNKCGRMSAKSVLESMKSYCESDAKGIETLLRVIPWESLSPEDEFSIWVHFTSGSKHRW